ncbi:acyl-CoA thioesterase domain-containing protein [Nocardioides sp.]|uniref:acyl-CoA thioesterase domain-containing protein n=1 Tax=Nocardioides sp. TaxID=35761 RepID=UPI002C7B6145|nr:acyl-CoA thioesterase domain-containing protein [Nocardioides sp.]HVX53864.1 acyl-CoA thioesterase domain-containing protein [Nocardioides sp.]
MSDFGFFRRDGDRYLPTPLARSLWSEEQMHGVALSGLLARELEAAAGALGKSDFVPGRYHVDLFRAARMAPTTVRTTIVRDGRRIALIDAEVVQGADDVVARARCTCLMPSQATAGKVWTSPARATPPPLAMAPVTSDPTLPLFASEEPWSSDFGHHQNGGRHASWQTAVPTVLDEPMTPFQAVAAMADSTSMITNWGTAGIEYINTDISLALARLPGGVQVGLRSIDHIAVDGVAVGVAEIFDRDGTIGTATVTALANTKRTVDMAVGGNERATALP